MVSKPFQSSQTTTTLSLLLLLTLLTNGVYHQIVNEERDKFPNADNELSKYLEEIKFDTETHRHKLSKRIGHNGCPGLRAGIEYIDSEEGMKKVLKEKEYVLAIVEAQKSNLPCPMLRWLKKAGLLEGMKEKIVFVGSNESKEWRDQFGMNADRLPKIFAFL